MADFSRIYRAPRSQSLQNFLGIGESPAQPDEIVRIASFSLPAWHATLLDSDALKSNDLITEGRFGYVATRIENTTLVVATLNATTAMVPLGTYLWLSAVSGRHTFTGAASLNANIGLLIRDSTSDIQILCGLASETALTADNELSVKRTVIVPSRGHLRLQVRNVPIDGKIQLDYWGYYLPAGLPPPY